MLVSIIVPCRNEAAHIGTFLRSLAAQRLPQNVSLEVLIADGNSDDGTREELIRFAQRDPSVRIIHNPGRIVSSGLNRAVALANGEVILRMDVHTAYARDYVAWCLRVLAESGADNVGGPARTVARSYMQRGISAAYHSRFACGGARFHDVHFEGDVDTVTFGCWRREAFLRFGLFDEELVRNQDDEHNLRIVRAGGRIFQSPRIRCWYQTRSSLWRLFQQYAEYGFWKVQVIRKHGSPASVRHLVPPLFVAALLLALLAALLGRPEAFLALFATYSAVVLGASLGICRRKWSLLPIMPIVLATYHVSYGLGFLAAIFRGNPRVRSAVACGSAVSVGNDSQESDAARRQDHQRLAS